MDENGLGKRIAFYRRQKGFSQEKLAEYMDVSRQAVSKWESGMSRPSSGNLIRLARLFGVSVDTLLDCESVAGEEPSDAPGTETGRTAWLFIGISFLCLLTYLVVSVSRGNFSVGTLICLFVLWLPIQLFLHLYFSYTVKKGVSAGGIAGLDANTACNTDSARKLLVQMDLYIGMISTLYIFLISAAGCVQPGIPWLNGALIIMYVADFCAAVLFLNYRMIDSLYLYDEDKRHARVGIIVTMVYCLLVFIGVAILILLSEINDISNNTAPALKLAATLLGGEASATVGFLAENRRIKKWKSSEGRYRAGRVGLICLILSVLLFAGMFLAAQESGASVGAAFRSRRLAMSSGFANFLFISLRM